MASSNAERGNGSLMFPGQPWSAYCFSRGAAGWSKAGPLGSINLRLRVRGNLLWAVVRAAGVLSLYGTGVGVDSVHREGLLPKEGPVKVVWMMGMSSWR